MSDFMKSLSRIAIPVTLQSMLQASFSIIDQIMIGQLGEVNIAAVGLYGNFSLIFSVVIGSVGTVAGNHDHWHYRHMGHRHPAVPAGRIWFALGHCRCVCPAYNGGDFPPGRLACHLQKAQLDDQPVTGNFSVHICSQSRVLTPKTTVQLVLFSAWSSPQYQPLSIILSL